MALVHEAHYAGVYYPREPSLLRSEVGLALARNHETTEWSRIGVIVVPHASYRVAVDVYAKAYSALLGLRDIDTVVIISPDHLATGRTISIDNYDVWKLPIGYIYVDKEFAKLLAAASGFELDGYAVDQEHGVENQLPWIVSVFGYKTRIVPITITYAEREDLEKLAASILFAARHLNRRIAVVATTDMTHFGDPETTMEQDMRAVDYISRLNHTGFLNYASENKLSWCGVTAVATAIIIAKKLGAKEARLVAYAAHRIRLKNMEKINSYGAIVFY